MWILRADLPRIVAQAILLSLVILCVGADLAIADEKGMKMQNPTHETFAMRGVTVP